MTRIGAFRLNQPYMKPLAELPRRAIDDAESAELEQVPLQKVDIHALVMKRRLCLIGQR
jgi:hypothetical protein